VSGPRRLDAVALVSEVVRRPSAYGRSGQHPGLFPDADELHLPATGHLHLLDHPGVHAALRERLA
jgi:hypothetical protein